VIKKKLVTLIIGITIGAFQVAAQTYSLSGTLVDKDENTPLEEVNVVLANILDTTKITWV